MSYLHRAPVGGPTGWALHDVVRAFRPIARPQGGPRSALCP
jgi:hypothetical protein